MAAATSGVRATVVLKLTAIGKVEDFVDAIDADGVERAASLMKRAKADA